MDCLYAKCIPCITDCVMAELEKLGQRFRIALRYSSSCPKKLILGSIARDERFERLTCMHKGTYADDCIVSRVMQHRCYIVATNDQALRRRIRKIPGLLFHIITLIIGVPIMFVGRGQYKVEKLPTELV
jgi:U3 small nucleolar RNA-associated protein 24